MSVCGQSGQAEDDSASEEIGPPNRDSLYKTKPASKVVRVLTVLAYLLSVSLAAILLSVYYVCVWKSPDLLPENRTELSSAQRASPHEYRRVHHGRHSAHHYYGGGDIAVNGDIISSTPDTISSVSNITNDSTEPSTDRFESTVPYDATTQGFNYTSDDIGAINATDNIT